MAEITRLGNVSPAPTHEESVEEPKVVRIAKLALILADKSVDDIDKAICIQVGLRTGFLTEEEAESLLAYREEIENFLETSEEEE